MIWIVSSYCLIGLLFSIYFAVSGCSRIDPAAASAGVLVRLMWIPAALALWPLLLLRIVKGEQT